MKGKAIVCIGVALTAVVSTLVDRLEHRQYVFSPICTNETLVNEGGRFARLHCMHHGEQWASPTKWIEHTKNLFLPSFGGEIKMAIGYLILNLVSWLNWIVGLVIAICVYRSVNVVYYHLNTPPKSKGYKCA